MDTGMDRVPSQPVKNPPNLFRAEPFSLDRQLSHIDPGTAQESEEFVRLIYEQRHIDLASDHTAPITTARLVVDADVASFIFK
jgi:hypothetical protein